ncbi:hypothetical protein TRVA0_028S00430 [Trichomonascus vanleenenianus]|uniref:DUF1761 domain-containing protein n=1 Tax=Trichomonascus vanleenenianus TaxID=2268995 RepID=UPI003ECAAF67
MFSQLPAIKPSAIVFGAAFCHASSFIVTAPVIGKACKKATHSDTKEEFLKSKEAAGAVCVYSNSLLTSALQSYAFSVLLSKTNTVSVKSAAIIGGLVFTISSLPEILTNAIVEKRPVDHVLAASVTALVDTVGLAMALTWWGFRDLSVGNVSFN